MALCDPRDGVLTLTDPRSSKEWDYDLRGFVAGGRVVGLLIIDTELHGKSTSAKHVSQSSVTSATALRGVALVDVNTSRRQLVPQVNYEKSRPTLGKDSRTSPRCHREWPSSCQHH